MSLTEEQYYAHMWESVCAEEDVFAENIYDMNVEQLQAEMIRANKQLEEERAKMLGTIYEELSINSPIVDTLLNYIQFLNNRI